MTVEEYHKMAEAGILKEEGRVELLEGKTINMSPIGSRHAACVEKIDELLKRALSGKAMARTQNPHLMLFSSLPAKETPATGLQT